MFDLTGDSARDYFVMNDDRWPELAALTYASYLKWGRGYAAIDLIGRKYGYVPKDNIDVEGLNDAVRGVTGMGDKTLDAVNTYDPKSQIVCIINGPASDGETLSLATYAASPTPEGCYNPLSRRDFETLVKAFNDSLILH